VGFEVFPGDVPAEKLYISCLLPVDFDHRQRIQLFSQGSIFLSFRKQRSQAMAKAKFLSIADSGFHTQRSVPKKQDRGRFRNDLWATNQIPKGHSS